LREKIARSAAVYKVLALDPGCYEQTFVYGHGMDAKPPVAVLAALTLALITGTVLAVSALLDLPGLVALLAGLGFLLSAVAVGIVAARATGRPGVGVKAALKWFWELLP
jgi:hypothetical protein